MTRTTPTDTAPLTLPRLAWRSRVLLPVALAPLAGTVFWLVDRPLYDLFRVRSLPGDLRRTFETFGQFGDFVTIVAATLIIYCLDRERVRYVLDWLLAVGAAAIIFNGIKILLGRARPLFGDPDAFLGPSGVFTAPGGDVLTALASSELRSMPSSHTTNAVIAAVFLGAMYPALRPMVYAWAALAGVLRIVNGAHWPSDVVVGALLAYPLSHVIVTRHWGVRGLDYAWRMIVDKDASPKFPELYARDAR